MGLIGYYYQQITGDSGLGATLGPFKGSVVALGGTMGFNFDVGQLPWSVRLKVYKEVHVENRLEGAGGFLTLAIPLYVAKANASEK